MAHTFRQPDGTPPTHKPSPAYMRLCFSRHAQRIDLQRNCRFQRNERAIAEEEDFRCGLLGGRPQELPCREAHIRVYSPSFQIGRVPMPVHPGRKDGDIT